MERLNSTPVLLVMISKTSIFDRIARNLGPADVKVSYKAFAHVPDPGVTAHQPGHCGLATVGC